MQTEVEESAGPPGISRAEAVDRLRAAWRQSDDLATLSHHLRTLLEPEADDDGLVVLEFAAREGSFAATDELVGLWERWPALDLLWRQALVRSLARRARAEPPVLALLQQRVLERAEIGEVLVSLFLAAPHWFAENGSAILAAYPHAKPAIVAAGQLLLASVENPNIPGASNASRRMLGELLDYDSAEVFDKLDAMLDAAPELGEALILEMASRQMDLRAVVVALRDRMSRDVVKDWLQSAIDDDLELLVYMAML